MGTPESSSLGQEGPEHPNSCTAVPTRLCSTSLPNSACSWCGAWPRCPGMAHRCSTTTSSGPASSNTTVLWTQCSATSAPKHWMQPLPSPEKVVLGPSPLCAPHPSCSPPHPQAEPHPSHDGSPAPLVVSLLSTPPGAVLHTLLSSRARLAAEVAPQLSVAVRNNLISTASVEPKPCFCKPCSRKPSSCKPCSSWPHSCSPPGSPLQMFSRLSPLPQPRTSPSRWAQCGVRPSPDALSLSRSLRGRREAGTGSEEQMMHRDNAGLSPAPAPLVSGSPPPPPSKAAPDPLPSAPRAPGRRL